MGFGLVPTREDVARWLPFFVSVRLLQAADSSLMEWLAARSVITAMCGLGLMDEPSAALSCRRAQELSRLVRKASAPEQCRAGELRYGVARKIAIYNN